MALHNILLLKHYTKLQRNSIAKLHMFYYERFGGFGLISDPRTHSAWLPKRQLCATRVNCINQRRRLVISLQNTLEFEPLVLELCIIRLCMGRWGCKIYDVKFSVRGQDRMLNVRRKWKLTSRWTINGNSTKLYFNLFTSITGWSYPYIPKKKYYNKVVLKYF